MLFTDAAVVALETFSRNGVELEKSVVLFDAVSALGLMAGVDGFGLDLEGGEEVVWPKDGEAPTKLLPLTGGALICMFCNIGRIIDPKGLDKNV